MADFGVHPLGFSLLKTGLKLQPPSVLTLEISRRFPLHFQNGNGG